LSWATFVLALAPSRAFAQSPPAAPETIPLGDWQLAPTLELRTRGEYRHDPVDIGGTDAQGIDGPRVRDAWAIFERARLGLGAERGALRAQFTLEDARAWGTPSASGVLSADGRFGRTAAHEAFIEVRTSSARPWFFRAGRQVVQWGDGRLVGAADFAPVSRALDAARAHAPIGVVDVELLAAILESPAPLGVSAGDTFGPTRAGAELFGAHGELVLDPLAKVELVGLARVTRGSRYGLDTSRFAQARDEGETYTGSLRVSGDAKGWKYAAEGAYQLGRISSASFGPDAVDRRAWAAAAYCGRRFEDAWLVPEVRIGFAYASGDDSPGPGTPVVGTYKQFDPILPDVHALHGAMDVFAWSNIVEAHARASAAPWTDALVTLEYRYARLAEANGDWIGAYLNEIGRAPTGNATELGHEIDFVFAYRPWPPFELALGYSLLALGDGARAILAASHRGAQQPDGTFDPSSLAHSTYLQMKLNVP
jgi:hypothetical protein